jgi:hypothetical protein
MVAFIHPRSLVDVPRMGRRRLDSTGSGYGQVAVCCEHGKESSVSIKYGAFS